jgi:hypothetical protein
MFSDLKKISKDRLRLISEIIFLFVFIGLFRQKALQKWINNR